MIIKVSQTLERKKMDEMDSIMFKIAGCETGKEALKTLMRSLSNNENIECLYSFEGGKINRILFRFILAFFYRDKFKMLFIHGNNECEFMGMSNFLVRQNLETTELKKFLESHSGTRIFFDIDKDQRQTTLIPLDTQSIYFEERNSSEDVGNDLNFLNENMQMFESWILSV